MITSMKGEGLGIDTAYQVEVVFHDLSKYRKAGHKFTDFHGLSLASLSEKVCLPPSPLSFLPAYSLRISVQLQFLSTHPPTLSSRYAFAPDSRSDQHTPLSLRTEEGRIKSHAHQCGNQKRFDHMMHWSNGCKEYHPGTCMTFTCCVKSSECWNI